MHLGCYVVKEAKAPDNFYNGSEEKPVTLTYAGENKEVVFADVTFNINIVFSISDKTQFLFPTPRVFSTACI